MSTSRRVTQHKAANVYGFKALPDEGEGIFEAYVAVFGNVDLSGERVVYKAFEKSLDTWAASGDPIPVIFSHQWNNLDAHVGSVMVAEEHGPDDPRLPAELAGLGGLYVKAKMDTDEDFAGRLWRKMADRRIREFSFAYDVIRAKPGAGGALDLLELELIEVGPTLKGMNPATVLVSAKSLASVDGVARNMLALDLLDMADALVADDGHDEKRMPAAALDAGAVEPVLAAVRESATVWAQLEYGDDFYALHLEGTYLEEGRCVVTAERWEDPLGDGPVWQLSFAFADDGTVEITDAVELELTVELAAKRHAAREKTMTDARAAMAWRSGKAAAIGAAPADTIPEHHGKAEPVGKAETGATSKAREAELAIIDAELFELDLALRR